MNQEQTGLSKCFLWHNLPVHWNGKFTTKTIWVISFCLHNTIRWRNSSSKCEKFKYFYNSYLKEKLFYLPSQLLFKYTDTNTGGTVKKSTTELTSSQNHSLSLAAMNWKNKKKKRGRGERTRLMLMVVSSMCNIFYSKLLNSNVSGEVTHGLGQFKQSNMSHWIEVCIVHCSITTLRLKWKV